MSAYANRTRLKQRAYQRSISGSAMASVLDGIRGIRFQELTHMIVMPDDEYAAYLTEVQRLSPKGQKKWKRHNVKSDGSTQTIRYDKSGTFFTRWLNERVSVKSVSMIAELECVQKSCPGLHGFVCQSNRYKDTPSYHTDLDRMQADSHTGKHRPRNHPISVPTRAGEPVRC